MRSYTIVFWCLALASASPAFAANVVTWDVSATVISLEYPQASSSDTKTSKDAVGAFDNLDASSSNGTLLYAYDDAAHIGFNGEASPAVLRAEMEGSVSSSTSGSFLTETSAIAGGSLGVSWSDNMILDPNLPVGTSLKVDASLILNGVYSGFAAGSLAANQHFATWAVSVNLTGLGVLDQVNGGIGTTLGSFQNGTLGTLNFSGGYPELIIPISFTVVGGQPEDFGVRMSLGGSATARTVSRGAPGSVTAGFSASFSHTLLWGGISSVTDLTTGLPVLDYTITSDSGFDYSQAASVPEASSALLIALGIGVLAIRRR